jgi:hypothetical protein
MFINSGHLHCHTIPDRSLYAFAIVLPAKILALAIPNDSNQAAFAITPLPTYMCCFAASSKAA